MPQGDGASEDELAELLASLFGCTVDTHNLHDTLEVLFSTLLYEEIGY